MQKIEADARSEIHKLEAASRAQAALLAAESEAETQRIAIEAEIKALREREAAAAYSQHPALLRLQELETLRELARTATARIYIGFDKHLSSNSRHEEEE